MSNYSVINDISNTLLTLLKSNMNGLVSSQHITLLSPAAVAGEEKSPKLFLYLYNISEDEHLKNLAMQQIDSERLQGPPLPLNLFYLLTPYASDHQGELQILGRAMQIFHDNSIVRGSLLQGSLSGTFEEIAILLQQMSLEDMNKLWSMFGGKPYKLSVSYKVSPALIDSEKEIEVHRVVENTFKYNMQI